MSRIVSRVVKIVPAQWATATVATLKPPKQTDRVKSILAGPTSLIRRLLVLPNNAIADSTFVLPF